MAAGTFYSSPADYDTLKGDKASGHLSVCKKEPAATESFPFCSRSV